jgi:hypothetical protein
VLVTRWLVQPVGFLYGRRTMSHRAPVPAAVILVVLCAALCWGADAPALSTDVVGTGMLVAWLSGLAFEASITAEIQLTGDVLLYGESVSFSIEGRACGFGVRGIVTLVSEGWVGYTAAGNTSEGEPIEIRGLLYVKRQSLVPLQANDIFVGVQHAVLLFRGKMHSFCGEFSGTVEGALEPSEMPGTIQLGGSATIQMEGDLGGFPATIPLDHPALPPEFLQYVAELDLGI